MKVLVHLFPLQIGDSGCAQAAGRKLTEGKGHVGEKEGQDEGKQQSDFSLCIRLRDLCQMRRAS